MVVKETKSRADARSDSAEFNDDADPGLRAVGARGASNQPTFRDHKTEDRETEESDATGRIPKREIDDLLSSATEDERNVSGYTRGNQVDAFKQERELDRVFDETGIAEEGQEMEIAAGTGRR